MKFAFRWFGQDDKVTLEQIRQIPNVNYIVSALYDVKVGEVWPLDKIQRLKRRIVNQNLLFEVIESVPIHEDIKLGYQSRDTYIDKYCETLRNLAKCGITCVCYNFMPVFDWTRTTMEYKHKDGSTSLALHKKNLSAIDPSQDDLSLSGWDTSYTKEEQMGLIKAYKQISEEQLWEHLTYFLQRILPVAKELGIRMAIHPDDPPYSIFGIPRIIKNLESYQRLFRIDSSLANGVTFCTGSLASTRGNDIYKLLEYCLQEKRVHFMHIRNIQLHEDDSFEEVAHCSRYGSLDMVEIMKILWKYGYDSFVRSDHGRMIWGEQGRYGYGLYDRAIGISYLIGIHETLEKGV